MSEADDTLAPVWSFFGWIMGIMVIVAIVGQLLIIALPYLLIACAIGFVVWLAFFSPSARLRKERKEIELLYNTVASLAPSTELVQPSDFAVQVMSCISEQIGAFPPAKDIDSFAEAFMGFATEAAGAVPPLRPIPETDDRIILARYRDELVAIEHHFSKPPPVMNPVAPVADCIINLLALLPRSALNWNGTHDEQKEDNASYYVTIGDLLEEPGVAIEHMVHPFLGDEVIKAGHFAGFREQIERNFQECGEMPSQHSASARELSRLFLKNTPLEGLIDARVPFEFPEEQRLEHMVVVAGSGHGKTQMLESLVCADLEADDPPGMVVIDSKGDMIERLSRLAAFDPDSGRLRDRLIVVDPHDSPSLNPFDIRLNENDDDQAVSRLIGGMSYFFQALLGTELSSTMRVALYPFLHLMLRIEGATLNTLIEAMANPQQYAEDIESLPDAPRNYLKNEYSRVRPETRNAIKDRVYDLRMMSPAFDRMFAAKRNALDLAAALNSGKIVLVNLDRDYLEREPSAILGKWFISQTYRAALTRSSLRPDQRKAAYLIVDEAGPYFDAQTEDILRTMRSYRVGAVLAFQDFSQAAASLQAAISSSTAIRLAGGRSDLDARILAPMLRTEPEFILGRRKRDRDFSEFACYVARLTPRAVSLSVPHGTVDRQDHMPEPQYRALRQRNRARLTDASSLPAPDYDRAPPQPVRALPQPTEPTRDVPHRDEVMKVRQSESKPSAQPIAPQASPGDSFDHTRWGRW